VRTVGALMGFANDAEAKARVEAFEKVSEERAGPSVKTCASSTAMMANVGAERLLKIPAEPSPELLIPGAAAQTRIVSKARIRLDSRKSVRSFKGIICDDISEFESSHPSHAVRSL
jgi:hypothetical protein